MKRLRDRGIALVTALFVVALAAIAATAMFEAAGLALHRSTNLAESEAELWYARGVEGWVEAILVRDYKLNPNVTGMTGLWAMPVDFLPIDNGGIRGHIEDLQGRFNLNSMAQSLGNAGNNLNSAAQATGGALAMQQFERLLDNLPNFDASQYRGISAAIRDWIDPDSERFNSYGAEDDDYTGLDPPYRAANRLMTSPSELMLVKGMTKDLYFALLPYVCTLPDPTTKINVNTAAEPVLAAIAPPAGINKSALQAFIAQRKGSPVTDLGSIQAGAGATGANNQGALGGALNQQTQFLLVSPGTLNLTVQSSYFELQAQVSIGSGRLALYSVFYRPSGTAAPVVLSHSTNTE